MSERTPRQVVHEAIGAMLGEGEIAVAWVLTIDVAGADGSRYLAHRAGGGHDGGDGPMAWTALGMLETAAGTARAQLHDMTTELEDPPAESEE